jgi:hypothetical protein
VSFLVSSSWELVSRRRTQFYALGGWDADFAECVAQGHLVEHHP